MKFRMNAWRGASRLSPPYAFSFLFGLALLISVLEAIAHKSAIITKDFQA
jgi:hypothetical protein